MIERFEIRGFFELSYNDPVKGMLIFSPFRKISNSLYISLRRGQIIPLTWLKSAVNLYLLGP